MNKCEVNLALDIIWLVDHMKYSLGIGFFLLLVKIAPLLYSHNINSPFLLILFSIALYLVNLKELDFHLLIIFFIVFSFNLK